MPWLNAYPTAFWSLLVDTGLWLIVGLAMAGVVHAMVPFGLLERHLAGRGAAPIVKAAVLGVPLPLCSCSVIPVAAGLRRGGAGKGACAAFAISTPQTGEESVPLTWALFGPVFAFARPVVAVATALVAGLLIDRFTEDRPLRSSAAGARPCCCSGSTPIVATPSTPGCCGGRSGAAETVRRRAARAARFAFGTMLIDLAPWLTLGLALAALVTAALPPDWLVEHVGSGVVPMLLMLGVGLPLYVCATSSTPLAASLVAAGLSPGAALVLLLAGPATNIATMGWIVKDLGWRALAIYLGTIAAMAVGCGLAVDAFLAPWVTVRPVSPAHAHDPGTLNVVAAWCFAALLAAGLIARARRAITGPTAPPAAAAGAAGAHAATRASG